MTTRFNDTETTCHCGADYKGSDHCPECQCEQYESLHCDKIAKKLSRAQIMEMFDGEEMWTNALGERFEERVCVLFDGKTLWNNGKQFRPTVKEAQAIYAEYWNEGEGLYLRKDIEEEFGQPGSEKFARVCAELGVKVRT